MGRKVIGVVGGLIAWIVVATILNWLMRVGWPGYAEAEKPMAFTLAMLGGRLVVGALSSIAAGVVFARITKGAGAAAIALGIVLLAVFLPVHFGLWEKFPVWYHAAFLISLLPLALLGARAAAPRGADGSVS
jgi:hypothetical protein